MIASWPKTLESFKSRDFSLLCLSVVLVMVAGQMNQMARGLLAYQLEGSLWVLGALSVAEAVPILCFSLFGGVVADLIDRKSLVVLGQAVTACLAFLIAIAVTTDLIQWTHLLIAAGIQGASWALTIPARNAMIPKLVGPVQLGNAMALIGMVMSSTVLIGPALGGVLYARFGPDGMYFVAGCTGALAVLSSSLIRRTTSHSKPVRKQIVNEIVEGIVEIWRTRRPFVLLAVALVFGLLTHPLRVFLPALVVDTYHKEAEALGLLTSMVGLGSLIGSLILASTGNYHRGLFLIFTGLFLGISMMVSVGIPVYGVALFVLLIYGIGEAGQRVLTQSLLMESVDDRYRGRVISFQEMKHGVVFLGALPAGSAAELLGVQYTIFVLGITALVFSIFLIISQKDLRSLW